MKDEDIVPMIGQPPYSFLAAKSDHVEAVFPQNPEPISGRFTLVGRLSGDRTSITLQYGFAGSPITSRSLTISRLDAANGSPGAAHTRSGNWTCPRFLPPLAQSDWTIGPSYSVPCNHRRHSKMNHPLASCAIR
jgi:hypothetical protein